MLDVRLPEITSEFAKVVQPFVPVDIVDSLHLPLPFIWSLHHLEQLGNSMRRLALPEAMKHWSLTSLQTRMIKTGGRLVRHAGRLVFQLAEVLVSREMLGGILERIGRLRLAPG